MMPPTSLVLPMFTRYLTTTIILVAASTIISVIVVNVKLRKSSSHKMSPWIRKLFLVFLPKLLMMTRPEPKATERRNSSDYAISVAKLFSPPIRPRSLRLERPEYQTTGRLQETAFIQPVHYYPSKKVSWLESNLTTTKTYSTTPQAHSKNKMSDDWVFVSMVMDRLFFIVFSILNIGSLSIILEAPMFSDYSKPMNRSAPSKPLGQAYV